MEIDDCRLFLDVVRHGSFAAVARERETDPSSVSRRIGQLEASLGCRLFERSTRRLAPTEAGTLLVDADLERGDLVDVLPAFEASAKDFDTAAWVLYPSRSYLPAKTRAFVDFVKADR